VESLKIELVFTLERHEAHARPLHRFSDCFRIEIVVFVRLQERLHELRWNQSNLMTLTSQDTA
jgi:hypothetical protein